jgi:hypothetical protein
MVPCIGKAMRCRSNLGLNERSAKGVVYARELRGESVQAVEGIKIAEKLHGQAFLIDNRLGKSPAAWISREADPGTEARAFQVNCGDLSICRRGTRTVDVRNRAHSAAPK